MQTSRPRQTQEQGPTTTSPEMAAPGPIAYTPRHLAERILAEQAALEARGDPDGERKTITALFADIKGSMDLLQDLDPEEARRLIDPALQLMMQAVHRYEGYVAPGLFSSQFDAHVGAASVAIHAVCRGGSRSYGRGTSGTTAPVVRPCVEN